MMLLVAAIVALLTALPPAVGSEPLPYSEFIKRVREGKVARAEIQADQIVAELREAGPSGATRITAVRIPNADAASIIQELQAANVEFSGRTPTSGIWGFLSIWLLPLLLLLLFFSASRLSGAGSTAFGYGKSKVRIYDQYRRSNVTFGDVAGVDEAEAELVEVVDFLKNPQRYTRLGGHIPKGVLLVGPPGTGKTLLAKAVAGEANVPFFSISGSEFMEIFVGVGAARVRDLFEQAKQRAPCIIFIDELDAIGKSRASGRGSALSNDEREQTLNQLLAEMDGFDTSIGVIIVAATNTPEVLDPALLRAGRFDRQVLVDRPDVDGREAILRVHAKKLLLHADVDLRAIASRTPGMVGADLANIMNESALLAARRQAPSIETRDIEEAIDRVMLGLQKKGRIMNPKEKERVAFHEAGHALAALSLEHADPVVRVSIIPRSIGALGHTLQLPTEDKFLMTRSQLEDQIAVMVSGRIAEMLTFGGEVSNGAANDLERASELARMMITRFGMSDALGNVTYGRGIGSLYLGTPRLEDRNYSEKTAELIDQEVRRVIDDACVRSVRILTGLRPALDQVARELIVRETLDRTRLDQIVSAARTDEKPVLRSDASRS